MEMENRDKKRHQPIHLDTLEDHQRLSQHIINSVNVNGPRSNFVRETLDLLLDFSGCDEVVLTLVQDEKFYICTGIQAEKRSFKFGLESATAGLEDRARDDTFGSTPLKVLCMDVFHGDLDSASPLFTESGSFWSGVCDSPFSYTCRIGETTYERELDVGGPYQSLLLVPIRTSDEAIGLLQFKSKQRDYFKKEMVYLFEDVAQTLGVVQAYRSTQAALRERLKELSCLYNIAQVAERPDTSLEQLLQSIVELLPPAWQYPDITSSRIVLDEKCYVAPGFDESVQKQSAPIVVAGVKRGVVEVVYTETKPEIYEGPFLKEERNLLDAVAREVSLIIERKEAEESQSRLQDQLRHADRLATIGQLAAGVAHELNEPLGNILGFAQLMDKAPEVPSQSKKDIEKIVSSTLHAREIVKKLMFFARQMPPEKVKCDLNRIVEEGIYFLGARCAKAGIELVRNLSDKLPFIVADPAQLHQVLINLAVNAMQAMPDGGVLTISTRADDDLVSLIVEDTGTGMTDDVIKQIFVPFFTTKDVDEGTGLGLAVVHGIVTSHGGSIDVESELGAGSRFVVDLPIEQQTGETAEE
jgi:two-component system NtrC family sensor kinase